MNHGKTMNTTQSIEAIPSEWLYFTIPQFIKKHPAFTAGGLRSLIFNEHSNGLAKSGAIVRIGRKILIRESKFFAWVETQNGNQQS
jgi:hypothetical protein